MSSDENKPTVYVKYVPGFWGLGDYLRGLSMMYTTFDNIYRIVPTFMHPLRYYLKYPGPLVWHAPEIFDIRKFPKQDPLKTLRQHMENRIKVYGEACILTNFMERPSGIFDRRLRSLFVLNDRTQKTYETYAHSLTQGRDYEILHIRTRDEFNGQAWDHHCDVLKREVPKIPQTAEVRIIIASDAKYRDYLKSVFPEYVYPVNKPCHLGAPIVDDQVVKHTFFEMKLCTEAKKIDAFTTYSWGMTGFTRIPASLFNVPYTVVQF